MSLANIKGKLSRKEMKTVMGGSGGGSGWYCCNAAGCGTCVASSGIPYCPSTSTLTSCKS